MSRQQIEHEYLYRRNTVWEALRSQRRTIHHFWYQAGEEKKLAEFLKLAREANIPTTAVDKQKLGHLAQDKGHQGVVLETDPYPYSSIDEILQRARLKNEKPFILLFDLLHGPQNIGALLRSAEACGVHGIIQQDRRAPDITPATAIASAGATEHLLIAQVTNLSQAIIRLKKEDIWFVGLDLDPEGKSLNEIDFDIPIGLIVGHEGSGLRNRVRQNCDFILQLPMRGQVESLNVSVAGSIALYFAWQARNFT